MKASGGCGRATRAHCETKSQRRGGSVVAEMTRRRMTIARRGQTRESGPSFADNKSGAESIYARAHPQRESGEEKKKSLAWSRRFWCRPCRWCSRWARWARSSRGSGSASLPPAGCCWCAADCLPRRPALCDQTPPLVRHRHKHSGAHAPPNYLNCTAWQVRINGSKHFEDCSPEGPRAHQTLWEQL